MSETATAPVEAAERQSWTPMVGLFLAQVLMSFNVSALPASRLPRYRPGEMPAGSAPAAGLEAVGS